MRSITTYQIILISLIFNISYACGADNFNFPATKQKAIKYAAQGEGLIYSKNFSEIFLGKYRRKMKTCISKTPKPNASPFDIIFVLSRDGNFEDIITYPSTNLAICFAREIVVSDFHNFPKPPEDHYPVYMKWTYPLVIDWGFAK